MFIKCCLPVAVAIACVSGCADEPEAPAGEVQVEATPPASTAPMPPLTDRLERVVVGLGHDVESVRAALRMKDGRLVLPRREALAALGPRARAALKRHNVRIEQLARFLQRGEP